MSLTIQLHGCGSSPGAVQRAEASQSESQSLCLISYQPGSAVALARVRSLLVFQVLALLGERCSQPVERVFQAGLIDGLQARLAGADARALMLIVAQAHVILICLRTYTTAAQHHVLSVVIVHSITMHPDFKCPALAVLGCECQQR